MTSCYILLCLGSLGLRNWMWSKTGTGNPGPHPTKHNLLDFIRKLILECPFWVVMMFLPVPQHQVECISACTQQKHVCTFLHVHNYTYLCFLKAWKALTSGKLLLLSVSSWNWTPAKWGSGRTTTWTNKSPHEDKHDIIIIIVTTQYYTCSGVSVKTWASRNSLSWGLNFTTCSKEHYHTDMHNTTICLSCSHLWTVPCMHHSLYPFHTGLTTRGGAHYLNCQVNFCQNL